MPDLNVLELLEENHESKQTLINFLSRFLPNRFAERFTLQNFPNKPINQLSKREVSKIVQTLKNWKVFFEETEGWHKAEVTLGGIEMDEISSQTFETKRIENLYFIGEVIDVTGWLGGYNFQWAWASGFAAGQAI